MTNKTEKFFFTVASAFCVAFGLITCNVPDFISGFLAGCASFITFSLWKDDADDNK